MTTYMTELRATANSTLPLWHMQTTHGSDQMAIDYWSKLFIASPDSFPATCDWIVIFCNQPGRERLVAEIIIETKRSIKELKIHD